jgi:hypothetical protein
VVRKNKKITGIILSYPSKKSQETAFHLNKIPAMKIITGVAFLLSALITHAQTIDTAFNGEKWIAPYTLPLPKGWGYERFLLPPEFAPGIKYTGVEDLRFAPDWTNDKSGDYWTYAYLWFLKTKVSINKQALEKALQLYYEGLIGRNIKERNIPSDKIVPTTVALTKIKTLPGDNKTFSGKINMLDYLHQVPVSLNCIIHLKYCTETGNTFLFFQLSPQPFSGNHWSALADIWSRFICSKNIDIN